MKKLYFKFILVLTFSLFLFNVFAEKPRLIYPEVIFPSTSGLGGNFSTYYKKSSVLFSNPALFAAFIEFILSSYVCVVHIFAKLFREVSRLL